MRLLDRVTSRLPRRRRTLARRGVARFSDRAIACEIGSRFASPPLGQVVVLHAPAAAARCGRAGVYVKRPVGLPGDVVREHAGARIRLGGRRPDEPWPPTRLSLGA
ncbi:MAG TPA: S26 family signal peptidase [Gaiellaceae bacterium]|nr:S26 family signal peptidase [Gaiellaceae bacterium]